MNIIDAIYIQSSGGKILLEYFIKYLHKKGILKSFYFLIDDRLESKMETLIEDSHKLKLRASERKRTEFYRKSKNQINSVFCFANVPPPIYLSATQVTILFHNALILRDNNAYKLKERLQFFAKRIYIKIANRKEYQWVVQTQSTKALVEAKIGVQTVNLNVLPFFDVDFFKLNTTILKENFFLYVADGVRQKNHIRLLEAVEILYEKYNIRLELHLTVFNTYPELIAKMVRMEYKGYKIVNHGWCNLEKVRELYQSCRYVVFPSLLESFGLPLVEAATSGADVITSDLPYVYDVIRPSAVFDPYSAVNMADTICQMLGSEGVKTEIVVENKIEELLKLIALNNV